MTTQYAAIIIDDDELIIDNKRICTAISHVFASIHTLFLNSRFANCELKILSVFIRLKNQKIPITFSLPPLSSKKIKA